MILSTTIFVPNWQSYAFASRVRRNVVFYLGWLSLIGLLSTSMAVKGSEPTFMSVSDGDEYSAEWGPALGTPAPDFRATDTRGSLRDVKSLVGDSEGVVLFFTRSTNW